MIALVVIVRFCFGSCSSIRGAGLTWLTYCPLNTDHLSIHANSSVLIVGNSPDTKRRLTDDYMTI